MFFVLIKRVFYNDYVTGSAELLDKMYLFISQVNHS